MKKTQIYLHGEGSRDPKLVEVAEIATVNEVINLYKQEFPGNDAGEEIQFFIEGEEDSRDKTLAGENAGIRKKVHIHCHRCKKIAVVITYNGEDKSFQFTPSATAKQVMKKAIATFKISDSDAADYLLKLDDKTILQPSDHIGSFASFPRCNIKLFLTPTKPVQG